MNRRVDITGQVFGSFVVHGPDLSVGPSRNTRWLLICKGCGISISRQTFGLRNGSIPTCLCWFSSRLAKLPDTTRAYIAGVYDGEGSMYIGLQSRSRSTPLHFLEISIANTDRSLLEWIQAQCGGRVSRKANVKDKRYKPGWTWKASAQQAALFLEWLSPFLRVKSSQAEVAIAFQKRVSLCASTSYKGLAKEEAEWRESQRQKLISIRRTA
jgi:hypothetical protein